MMVFLLDTEKLKKDITRYSDRALLMIETKITNRIAGIEKCMDWPRLVQALAKDLEVIWAEQKRRELQRNDKR
jgi:hypothetical protein